MRGRPVVRKTTTDLSSLQEAILLFSEQKGADLFFSYCCYSAELSEHKPQLYFQNEPAVSQFGTFADESNMSNVYHMFMHLHTN